MILAILAESALRSLLLGGVVWIGLNLLRVRNPHVHMTTWIVVLAYTQLRLARQLVADRRLPWERSYPPGGVTPYRVRRASAR